MSSVKKKTAAKKSAKCSFSFQSVKIEALYPVMDAIAWLDLPDGKTIAQFAGIDPRTAGKLLKNCLEIGVAQTVGDETYVLQVPYPPKGDLAQKRSAIKDAMIRLPLLQHLRQFLNLGDTIENATRKAATMEGVINYDSKAFAPFLKWAAQLEVLKPGVSVEDLVDSAVESKVKRHQSKDSKIVAFLSHSSKDKAFIRQLASDLDRNGITVWLDEKEIRVGDSIVEKVGQGLADSDYFLIALSEHSVSSPWVTKELNHALVREIEKREVKILPLMLSECEIPDLIRDKLYADFSTSYKTGLSSLLESLKSRIE